MVTAESIVERSERIARSTFVGGLRVRPCGFTVDDTSEALNLFLYGIAGLFPFRDSVLQILWRVRRELLLLAVAVNHSIIVCEKVILDLDLRGQQAWE